MTTIKLSSADYVKTYYENNFADGTVDDEVASVGLFVAQNAKGKVLDCGCGPVPQIWAICMPQMSELSAIDLPQESIEFVKEKINTVKDWYKVFRPYQSLIEDTYGPLGDSYIIKQVEKIKDIRQADMTQALPFLSRYFDTVISFYSLGCLRNEAELDLALSNIEKVLKVGGKFLYINTDGNNTNESLPAYTWRGLQQSNELVKRCLLAHGFDEIIERTIDLPPNPDRMYSYSKLNLLSAVLRRPEHLNRR